MTRKQVPLAFAAFNVALAAGMWWGFGPESGFAVLAISTLLDTRHLMAR